MAQHLVSGSYERFVFAHKVPVTTLGPEQVRRSPASWIVILEMLCLKGVPLLKVLMMQDATLEKGFAFPAHKV